MNRFYQAARFWPQGNATGETLEWMKMDKKPLEFMEELQNQLDAFAAMK